jgi:hypothetical protein
MTITSSKWLSAALLVLAFQANSAQAQQTSTSTSMSERSYAGAVTSFQQGRFPEAYGRLIPLADSGHAAAAELALWMYEHGNTVFGRDWDSTPEQLRAWSVASNRATTVLAKASYSKSLIPVVDRRR